MKNKLSILLFILFLFQTIGLAYSSKQKKQITITATTSNIATLIKEICKDKVNVITIIPSTLCPSNYDVDARTMKEISTSNAIIYHLWQQELVSDLKYKITNLGIIYRQLKTEGNLMIPYINLAAAKEFYEKNFLDYTFKINFICEQIKKNSYNRYNKKIVCNSKLESFMQWLGFDVVIVYGNPNNLSSLDLTKISNKIKDNNVKYIVDNLQVGTDIGRTLSKELNLKQIIISNFALGNSYINTLKNNIEKIDKVLE